VIRLDYLDIGTTIDEQVTTCVEEILEEATHSQGNTSDRIAAHRSSLEQRIRDYITRGGDPEFYGSTPFPRSNNGEPKSDGDLMYDRYRSGNSTDNTIVSKAKGAACGYCPMCGLYMSVKPHGREPDRDHIIPRSKYPEFSLLCVNLVILCDDCNTAKGNKVFDPSGKWMFLHPYYDDVLSKSLLRVSVNFIQGTPRVDFKVISKLAGYERVERHFDELDLACRYADGPLDEASSVLKVARKFVQKGSSVETARQILCEEAGERLDQRPNDPIGHILLAFAHANGLAEFLKGP
jgi:5-methylcytosine-specific restriction endonuclease McrA